MGRFQSSDSGGQVDPSQALRREREAVSRERAGRGEGHAADPPAGAGHDVDRAGEALRERDHEDHGADDDT